MSISGSNTGALLPFTVQGTTGGYASGAIDTSSAQSLIVTGQLEAAADYLVLQSVLHLLSVPEELAE